ncbi:MAG: Mur ligase family protein, partial [Elusimicrobiota bacterium]
MEKREGALHFVGVCGSGMSALAQFHAMGGGEASGSDRYLDRGESAQARAALAALGVRLFPQDGTGVSPETSEVAVSSAIEESNPVLAKAKALGLPILHRSDLLARHVHAMRTVAVSGTSGKSTVTAMIFEILERSGRSPSVITGGDLLALKDRGLLGNALRGKSDLLVVEADESDGSLVRYRPWLGVLLNLGKDHKEVSELAAIFRTFRSQCPRFVVNGDAANLAEYRQPLEGRSPVTFGFSPDCSLRGEGLSLSPGSVLFSVRGVGFALPLDGKHNAENALAAAAACLEAGVSLEESARALSSYRGVSRRFELAGESRGVIVIDDYAHNPDKVRAALAAAQLRSGRVLAVYQPHGYGPTRFLKNDLIAAFSESLRPEDRLWLAEIYYAGGTAVKDISSRDIAGPIAAGGKKAAFLPGRDAIALEIAKEAHPGDLVLVMGARDP